MFTGIISNIGVVEKIEFAKKANEREFILQVRPQPQFAEKFDDVILGESIAIEGVCLTVTQILKNSFEFFVSHETDQKTNLGQLKQGSKVNMERALRLSDRLSGHLVQGHVESKAELVLVQDLGENGHELTLKIPSEQEKFLMPKGSVTLNGISLTVNSMENPLLMKVAIIPHTWTHTTLQYARKGDHLNLEVDMLAKMVEKLAHAYIDKRNERS